MHCSPKFWPVFASTEFSRVSLKSNPKISEKEDTPNCSVCNNQLGFFCAFFYCRANLPYKQPYVDAFQGNVSKSQAILKSLSSHPCNYKLNEGDFLLDFVQALSGFLDAKNFQNFKCQPAAFKKELCRIFFEPSTVCASGQVKLFSMSSSAIVYFRNQTIKSKSPKRFSVPTSARGLFCSTT